MTKEEWDENLPSVMELGVNPANVKGLEPNHRDTLPTRAEWNAGLIPLRERRSA
jgi:hypothetical protein